MNRDFERIDKAKLILEKIAKGVNPVTGEQIENDSFLNDPRVIRCFYFVTEILDNVRKGAYNSGKNTKFIITPEQKGMVEFPANNIGVNEFSKHVNACLDLSISKKLSGTELNKRLKKLGILSEEKTEESKTRTITNEKSKEYGFESEKRSFNGVEYEMVVINDKGKNYLLENIEAIMES
ncbi:hypothetical protein [Alkaliphilus serpentinus]|uniref:Uncharacterized protein n=1 Tax=Alkaliphilus serpentinus TaxID=1482731 RepID=A0A833HNC0_9FIRM|nr:hypothetical protein [Alkaliphilus serpentinus]KAB3529393.1 hypothetical protein F8153_09165 [Alkaliphilus serpentinus]